MFIFFNFPLFSGEWKIFNGNEMAALLGWWCWHCHQLKGSHKPGVVYYM